MAANVELGIKLVPQLKDDPSIDAFTQRPRTPNNQYTRITEAQRKRMSVEHSPHFMLCTQAPMDWSRQWKPRHVNMTTRHVVRGPTADKDYLWIDEAFSHEPSPLHNTSRPGAFQSWGPHRVGERTLRHFSAETRTDYTPIDCYRRPPTNQPGPIIFKYGRPNDGYYSQRFPSETTWFGSSCRLNNTGILQDIKEKTFSEYEQRRAQHHNNVSQRIGKFPEYSEYVDRYDLRNRLAPVLTKDESSLDGLKRKSYSAGADRVPGSFYHAFADLLTEPMEKRIKFLQTGDPRV